MIPASVQRPQRLSQGRYRLLIRRFGRYCGRRRKRFPWCSNHKRTPCLYRKSEREAIFWRCREPPAADCGFRSPLGVVLQTVICEVMESLQVLVEVFRRLFNRVICWTCHTYLPLIDTTCSRTPKIFSKPYVFRPPSIIQVVPVGESLRITPCSAS